MRKRLTLSALSPLIEEQLQYGGEVIFTITGSSMQPMLYHRRDQVCITAPKEGSLRKYDLPLFKRQDGKYILHRVVDVKTEGYVVRGDNQGVNEYPIVHSQVIGVVKGFWREGRYISCDNLWYRLYCRLWSYSYFVRWLCSRFQLSCSILHKNIIEIIKI